MIRVRNKIHITIIAVGILVAVAGAALYGVGFVGMGFVLLFCGSIAAAATNTHRDCRNQRV